MSSFPIISLLTFLPVLGGLIVIGLGTVQRRYAGRVALGFSFASLALALVVWAQFDPAAEGYSISERHRWIRSLGVEYFVGVDGLGLLMVMLTALLFPMALFVSANLFSDKTAVGDLTRGGERETNRASANNPHLYYALMLFFQAGLFGVFTALNFFHWFLFWELSLVPAFFLVRLWGGPQRAVAATQFFIYTMVGSIAMLLSFLAIFLVTSTPGSPGIFDFVKLHDLAASGELNRMLVTNLGWLGMSSRWVTLIIFGGVLLGFAVKTPLMPFHTWLPATYAEAPTPVTMLLTGAMSKMGVYGFIRILLPIFAQEMQRSKVMFVLQSLAVMTIVFSACAAFAQRDLKRILAYSSINHLGYCLLGIFSVAKFTGGDLLLSSEKSAALSGVFLQMFNHGLTAATLFMFVALLEKRSGGLRGLDDFGGLRKVAPVFCGLMGIALFSSLGLPGLNGFVGEFLIFKGVFPLSKWAAAFSVIGLLVTAIFILTILQRVFNGPLNEKWSKLPDLTLCERLLVAVPIALMFVLGVCPQLLLNAVNPTIVRMVEHLNF